MILKLDSAVLCMVLFCSCSCSIHYFLFFGHFIVLGVKAELVARLDSYYESMEGSGQQGEVGVESNENSSEAQEMGEEPAEDEEEGVEEVMDEGEEESNEANFDEMWSSISYSEIKGRF